MVHLIVERVSTVLVPGGHRFVDFGLADALLCKGLSHLLDEVVKLVRGLEWLLKIFVGRNCTLSMPDALVDSGLSRML